MTTPSPREPIVVRETSWATIILVLIATFAIITSIAIPAVVTRLFALGDAIANLIIMPAILIVAIGVFAILVGGLRPRDVGWRLSKIPEAIVVVLLVWIVIQLAHAGVALASGRPLEWDGVLRDRGIAVTLLWLAAMLFGTALTEETVFRGFLFPQVFLKSPGSPRSRYWIAVIVAGLCFGLLHVPRHIILGDMHGVALVARILAHMVGGLLAATLYLRTRNLWLVIGLHGLDNAPTRLVQSPMPAEPPLLLAELALLIFWPQLMRRPTQRGLAPIIRV